jgi:hypothetical protein
MSGKFDTVIRTEVGDEIGPDDGNKDLRVGLGGERYSNVEGKLNSRGPS